MVVREAVNLIMVNCKQGAVFFGRTYGRDVRQPYVIPLVDTRFRNRLTLHTLATSLPENQSEVR